jgi:hypothetical protein
VGPNHLSPRVAVNDDAFSGGREASVRCNARLDAACRHSAAFLSSRSSLLPKLTTASSVNPMRS